MADNEGKQFIFTSYRQTVEWGDKLYIVTNRPLENMDHSPREDLSTFASSFSSLLKYDEVSITRSPRQHSINTTSKTVEAGKYYEELYLFTITKLYNFFTGDPKKMTGKDGQATKYYNKIFIYLYLIL